MQNLLYVRKYWSWSSNVGNWPLMHFIHVADAYNERVKKSLCNLLATVWSSCKPLIIPEIMSTNLLMIGTLVMDVQIMRIPLKFFFSSVSFQECAKQVHIRPATAPSNLGPKGPKTHTHIQWLQRKGGKHFQIRFLTYSGSVISWNPQWAALHSLMNITPQQR